MKNQIHSKFKFFVIDYKEGKLNAKVKKEILTFANNGKITPKSIGIEFIESNSTLVISLGYSEKKSKNKFDISIKKVGKFTGVSDVSTVEKNMEKISAKVSGIICHEFFTTNAQEMFSVFLIAQ